MNDRCVNCYRTFEFEFADDGWERTHCKHCGEPLCLACMQSLHGFCSIDCTDEYATQEEHTALAAENAKLRAALEAIAEEAELVAIAVIDCDMPLMASCTNAIRKLCDAALEPPPAEGR